MWDKREGILFLIHIEVNLHGTNMGGSLGEVGRGGGPETDPNTDHTLLLLIHMAMSGTTEALSLGSEGVFSFLLPGEA